MLREVKNVRFERRLTLFGWRYHVVEGGAPIEVAWRRRAFEAIQREQDVRPVELFTRAGRTYWTFERRVFWEDGGAQRRRRARAGPAAAAARAEDARPRPCGARRRGRRSSAGSRSRARSGSRCSSATAAAASSAARASSIQYDHVIPVALGGAATVENLQILCAPCNRAKGASLG